MKTGHEASYNCSNFTDFDTHKPEHIPYELWCKMSQTVDTQRTINLINDEEKLKCMSGYVTSIDWTGTKYN